MLCVLVSASDICEGDNSLTLCTIPAFYLISMLVVTSSVVVSLIGADTFLIKGSTLCDSDENNLVLKCCTITLSVEFSTNKRFLNNLQ